MQDKSKDDELYNYSNKNDSEEEISNGAECEQSDSDNSVDMDEDEHTDKVQIDPVSENDDVTDYDTDEQNISGSLKSKFISVFNINRIPSGKRFKVISIVIILFLITILILTDIIPILPNAYNRFYVGNTYVIGETQGGVYDKFAKGVLYAGNEKVMFFGPDMSCGLNIDSPPGKPIIETNDSYAVVHYIDTGNAIFINDKNKTKIIKLNDIIRCVAVSKNGYYAIASDEPGYESCVEVFDKNHISIYKWHTNNHIIDVAISDDGKKMAAVSYTTNENLISAKLIFLSLSSDKPTKEITLDANVVSEVRFVDNDTVIAFGDVYTEAFSSGGTSMWRIDYQNRIPKSYDITQKGSIGFVFDRYSSTLSDSSVELYDKSGNLIGTYNSKNNIKAISCNNEYFLLSLDRQTVLLDKDADVVKIKNTSKDFKKAVLYNNYNFAFAISDGIAEILSVKH